MSDMGEGRDRRSARSTGGNRNGLCQQVASIANRWWENPGSGATSIGPSARPPMPTPGLWQPASSAAVPLPVALPVPPAPATESTLVVAQRQRLELELEAARAEVAALHEMLEDLPEIFERKFRQRVQGLLEEQQRLLNDNQLLRDRLYALTPATPTAPPALRGDREIRLAGLPLALPGSLRSALDGLRRRPAKSSVSGRPGVGRTRAA